ncbi:MAG: hypothetical protein JRJ65_20010 [Deltaproteobacteria bacterium]|nr:hypothetical protein [Deltaproteobacteria bacterium]
MSNLKICSIAAVSLFLFVVCFTHAFAEDSYKYDMGIAYMNFEDNDEYDASLIGVGGAIHFQDVNTSGHVLGEAAFLERIGDFNFFLGKDSETDGNYSPELEIDGQVYSLGFDVMSPDSPALLEISVAKYDMEAEPPYKGEMDMDIIELRLGGVVRDNFLVYGIFSKTDIEMNGIDGGLDDKGLGIKYVNEFDNKAVNIEASVTLPENDDGDDGTETNISVDYYFCRFFSLGYGITKHSGDLFMDSGLTHSLGLLAFMSESCYLEFEMDRFDPDDIPALESDTVSLALGTRF